MVRIYTKYFYKWSPVLIWAFIFIQSANSQEFKFAYFTDLHISTSNPDASIDLHNSVECVNKLDDIDFIIVSGDITETGDLLSLQDAKTILDKLQKPYFITPGNHETKWSESGSTDFNKVFGDDKFSFQHNGIHFIGFATGPVIKMGDGHISPQDISWVKNKLAGLPENMPVIAITHYPLLPEDVDNWYDMTDVLRKFNVQLVLGGHYHKNLLMNYDGITGVLNRSTLRSGKKSGGFNIYSISDSIRIFENITDKDPEKWITLPLELKKYNDPDPSIRPDYSINSNYPNVEVKWKLNIESAIYTSPAVNSGLVFFGDDTGIFHSLDLKNGKEKWTFKTGSRIISSPAVELNHVVFGSTDGFIYCLDSKKGDLIWKVETSAAVMGCPLIKNDTVFIGGSDGTFRALKLSNGKSIWTFDQIKGYIETKAVAASGKIMFGAWDSWFYALNLSDGSLAWKWNNGSTRMHYSPAAVHPVVTEGKVFITAPDRYITALDIVTGQEKWRTKDHQVRETIGISNDGKKIFSRYMNDFVIALDAKKDDPEIIWKKNAGFGYDHNPSMLIENNGTIIFGTKNGLLVGIDSETGDTKWKHKIGNSIINTITPVSDDQFILTTTGGEVARIKY